MQNRLSHFTPPSAECHARALAKVGSLALACAAAVSAMAVPARAEGPNAVVYTPGCTASTLGPTDDGSTGAVPIGFQVSFHGSSYGALYVNNNGNVTFDEPLPEYPLFGLSTTGSVIIAPFFADVDTRHPDSDVVRYGQTTHAGRPAFCATWAGDGVGYYDKAADRRNSFQLLLVDRSDVAPGDFDIVMNYDRVEWETGDANDGEMGLGGESAYIGFSGGTLATTFEKAGSGAPGSFLDTSPTGLIHGSHGSAQLGRYVYAVRDGVTCLDGDGDGVTTCDGDCDDTDAGVLPAAGEVCDETDNDCDGDVDEDGACDPTCIEIRDGVNGTAQDTFLSGDHPSSAAGMYFGAHTGVSSGGHVNRALFRFDLAPVQAAAGGGPFSVVASTMQVSVAWNGQYTDVNVHQALGPWSEATVTAASYPSSQWDAVPLTSFEAGGVGRRYVDLTDLVQGWLDGSIDNHGVLFEEAAPGSSHYFYTREASGPAYRPSLEVCFLKP